MHKGKVLSISFPVKSSKELASRLGVSKARTQRISAIIMSANGSERAKNLAKDYPEFRRVPPNTKLGTLREESGETSLDGVRRWIRKNKM